MSASVKAPSAALVATKGVPGTLTSAPAWSSAPASRTVPNTVERASAVSGSVPRSTASPARRGRNCSAARNGPSAPRRHSAAGTSENTNAPSASTLAVKSPASPRSASRTVVRWVEAKPAGSATRPRTVAGVRWAAGVVGS